MKEYTVMVGGVEHTMLLSDADAKKYAAVEVKAAAPMNKARTSEPDTRSSHVKTKS